MNYEHPCFLYPYGKLHCDKARTDTQEKSPELKTAYRKSPVVSVYINSKLN